MARYTPQQLLDHYNDMSEREKREFNRLVKGQQNFKAKLDLVSKALTTIGPEAVTLALKGDTEKAKAAAAAYRAANKKP